jgi:WD40 repeat protein
VNCAVFGPDGRWVVSGSADNTIRLWDVESGRELRALAGHKNWIKSLAVSSRGDLLASGSNDHNVKLWSVSSGRELHTMGGHTDPVEALAFSPDDRWLASGSDDTNIRIWDTATGREVQNLRGHGAAVTALVFSPDGKTLASGSADNTIKFWNTTDWSPSRTLNGHTSKLTSLAFSLDSKQLASGSAGGAIIVWDLATGRSRITLKPSPTPVLTLRFSPVNQLSSISADGTRAVWNSDSGRELHLVPGEADSDQLICAALSNDGKLFSASIGNRFLEIRSATSGTVVNRLESHAAGFFTVALSRDGRWLASGANDRSLRLWQNATGREMPRLLGHTGWVKAIAFGPDSRQLASASNSGEVKLWDVNTGRQLFSVAYQQERLHTIAISDDGKSLATAGTGRTIHLLDLTTRQSRELAEQGGEITSLSFIPHTRLLAAGSTDKTVKFWDTTSGNVIRTSGPLAAPINAITVDPEGTTLAAGTADGKITLVQTASGAAREFANDRGEVFSLAFSPDGRWLATGGLEHAVRVRDTVTGREARTLAGAGGEVNSLAFSQDSRFLISGNGDGSMSVWDNGSGGLTATLVSVPLTDDWLVVSPDGLFDGSHAAWKLLLWRFAADTFKIAPVESFFNEFYYPGLLADILAGKSPQAKANILEKDRRQPQIRLEAVAAGADDKIADRRVRLKLEITEAPPVAEFAAGSGVRDLRLFRNGLLVQTWPGDVMLGRSQRLLETSVTIMAGTNEFTAYAFNHDNVKSPDTIITVQGAPSLRREGTAYLFVVGVGSYANPQYNLNYSVADATDIGQQLKRQQEALGRYRPIEVVPLLNQDATKANILLALRLLSGAANGPLPPDSPAALARIKPAQPEDAVLFYFSGHGTARQDRFYLIPHDLGYQGERARLDDAGLAMILDHSISDLELETALRDLDVDQLLLVIDACNSGQALKAAEARRGPMNTRGLAQLAYEKGMYILTASQSDEVAFESAGLKHSYLAYALVEEGLKSGAADEDRNGEVFLKEWFDYATERVPRIGREKTQTGKQLEEVDSDEQRVQRPRVFNMREGGAERFVVARTDRRN